MKAITLENAKVGMKVRFNRSSYDSQRGVSGVITNIGVYGMITVMSEDGDFLRGWAYTLDAMPILWMR